MNLIIKTILKSLAFLAALTVLWQAVIEFYTHAPKTGQPIEKLPPVWAAAGILWLLICLASLILIGYLLFGTEAVKNLIAKWLPGGGEQVGGAGCWRRYSY